VASAFVVTGGPAVGKTTLITALTRLGYTTVRESARDIIIAEQALDSLVLPWRE
jgi:predicted ATPase